MSGIPFLEHTVLLHHMRFCNMQMLENCLLRVLINVFLGVLVILIHT